MTKKLIKFGIFISNDSNGDIEIQKVDDVNSLELDFTPINLKK